jgi:hypothetical protein
MCRRSCRFEDLTPSEQEALRRDAALSGVARSLGAFDLALGATVARLIDRGHLPKLCYAREADYARERLGISPSEMHSCVRLARELRWRPILRAAVTCGAASKRKALAVLPLAIGDHEGAWTEAAMRLSVRELESAAKAAGSPCAEERFEAEAVVLPMTPEQQDRLDAALALAKEDMGAESKPWQCTEAIAIEYLESFAEFDAEGPGEPAAAADARGGAGAPGAPPQRMSRHAERVIARQLDAIAEAMDEIRRIEEEHPEEDPLALDARARRFVAARRRYDETLGILAREFRNGRHHAALRYSFDAYCEERLGMRAGTVRQRIWLEGRMQDLPPLREALSSGRIGYAKALVVARRATLETVREWISRAERTTCQQLEREAQEEEAREHRKRGTRNLWSPSDAAETVRDAIRAAQRRALAEEGVAIDAGEALARVADHFVDLKEKHRTATPWMSEFRRRALMRKGGLCAVPGCSRACVHVHHVVFRSRGGTDDAWNGVALCAVHHLHGVHMGYLEVAGRAGERLYWRFATGEAFPTEEWETFGDNDVRRPAAARGSEAKSGAGSGAGNGAGTEAGTGDAGSHGPAGGDGATDVESEGEDDPGVTDVESATGHSPDLTDAESRGATPADADVVSEPAAAAYLHDDPHASDRRSVLACEEARAA